MTISISHKKEKKKNPTSFHPFNHPVVPQMYLPFDGPDLLVTALGMSSCALLSGKMKKNRNYKTMFGELKGVHGQVNTINLGSHEMMGDEKSQMYNFRFKMFFYYSLFSYCFE